MQIESSNYGVKFSSAIHKVEVFQFIWSGFFLRILGVSVAYLRASLWGKLCTYQGKNHADSLGLKYNYTCFTAFNKNDWKYIN